MSTSSWINLPVSGGGARSWKAAVANSAALPMSSNTAGDARVTLDDQNIWVWSGSAWVDVGGGTVTLDPTSVVYSNGLGNLASDPNIEYSPNLVPYFPALTSRGFFGKSDVINSPSAILVLSSLDTSLDSFTTAVGLLTGSNTAVGAANDSGALFLTTGQVSDATSTARTGGMELATGINLGTGNSGTIDIVSGSAAAGNSGNISFLSGNSDSGNTGTLTFRSGEATAGNSGNVLLASGPASATRGTIQFQNGSEGTAGHIWTSIDTTGSGSWLPASGGGSPGGSDTQVQFNDSNAFGGSANLLYDKTTGTLSTQSFNLLNTGTPVFLLTSDSTTISLNGVNASGSDTDGIIMQTGSTNTAGSSGSMTIKSGDVEDGFSGSFDFNTGDAAGEGSSGGIVFSTGVPSGDGDSGSIFFACGDAAGAGVQGEFQFQGHLSFPSNPGGSVPTIAAQSGLGSGSSVSMVANSDTCGKITLVAGTTSLASGAQAVITFAKPYFGNPLVQLTPANATAGTNTAHYYVTATGNDFTINFATASVLSLTYVYNFFVISQD